MNKRAMASVAACAFLVTNSICGLVSHSLAEDYFSTISHCMENPTSIHIPYVGEWSPSGMPSEEMFKYIRDCVHKYGATSTEHAYELLNGGPIIYLVYLNDSLEDGYFIGQWYQPAHDFIYEDILVPMFRFSEKFKALLNEG